MMKADDARKVFSLLKGVTSDALDHVTKQLADRADLAAEHADLGDLLAAWSRLSKKARKLFVGELMKSYALVVAGAAVTKAGLSFAGDHQKQLRKLILFIADVVQPGEKTKKKLKKKAKKAKKKLAAKLS
jgi:hypothetical protein